MADTPGYPFWGEPTAKANFCEEDYVVTRYVAEFINTLTNTTYILYALYGLRSLQKKGNYGTLRALPYWGLMGVGICSGVFHTSLKYHTQMMDDLSMLFTTTPLLHRVLTVNSTPRNSAIVGYLLGSTLIALVVYHVLQDEMILHASFFVVSIVVIGVRTMQLINSKTAARSTARRQIWGMVRFGAVIFHLGYLVWVVDGKVCKYLKELRGTVGLPWAFFLELHGWWHIFTGIGAYMFIASIDHLTSNESNEDIDDQVAWPAPWASRSIFAGKSPLEGGVHLKQV